MTRRSDSQGPSVEAAVRDYTSLPRPAFTRLPFSYRHIPIGVRLGLLGLADRLRLRDLDGLAEFECQPLASPRDYLGHRAAFVITHDIDSSGELGLISGLRDVERQREFPSAWGFVPKVSWPAERLATSLVDEGCEVYWHDIGHDGRLPWMQIDRIRREFDHVAKRHPWAMELMRSFRSGQLLMSDHLLSVVSERFDVDLSIPDLEVGGPYGGAVGCRTVHPFRIGPLLEIPLTLPQDVFLRHVFRLTPVQVVDVWRRKLEAIVEVGGVAVLNIHPLWVNAARPGMFDAYQGFLDLVRERTDLLVTTPRALARVI